MLMELLGCSLALVIFKDVVRMNANMKTSEFFHRRELFPGECYQLVLHLPKHYPLLKVKNSKS